MLDKHLPSPATYASGEIDFANAVKVTILSSLTEDKISVIKINFTNCNEHVVKLANSFSW